MIYFAHIVLDGIDQKSTHFGDVQGLLIHGEDLADGFLYLLVFVYGALLEHLFG